MARYNGLIIPRSYNDYYSRSDPQAIRDIVALAADGELNAESKNPLQNQAIAKIVPATASPDNKLIVQSQISGLTTDVETIKNIIPNTASETNELADKNFVNSTVGTNTANYIYKTESGGEKVPFSSVAELEAYAGTVTNNDYAFVTGIDENGNTYYDRYKADVNDGVVTWAKEYRLNNSSFTAEQWAAIQSGITAEKVAQFEGAVAPVDVVQSGNMHAVTSNAVAKSVSDVLNDVKEYVSPSLVYNTDRIEVYRQVGTYTFQFRGCNLTEFQTAINTVLNGKTLPHSWTAFISRRDAANNNIFPCTLLVEANLVVKGWYSNGSGIETEMNTTDTIWGNVIIVVVD